MFIGGKGASPAYPGEMAAQLVPPRLSGPGGRGVAAVVLAEEECAIPYGGASFLNALLA